MRQTTMLKPNEVEHKWYVVDATDCTLGRLATQVATVLRGKHKPAYTPHVDCGEFVIIINASKAVLTGKKLEQKKYSYHTGYIGGLKQIGYKELMMKKPEMAIELAVKGMLPKNSIGRKSITRLKVYAGDAHKQQAQQPIAVEVK